jgi:hypothetical protein
MNYPEEGMYCVCGVCGKSTDGIGECVCPECPKCGVVGDPCCEINEGKKEE